MLTLSDAGSILKGGILGCVAGVIYQISFIAADRFINPSTLDIATDILHEDTELSQLYSKLQIHRMVDNKSFEESIVYADRMMYLLHQLSTKTIKATVNDRIVGYSNYNQAIKAIEKIVSVARTSADASVEAELHKIYTDVFEKLTQHWKAILKLTKNV
jgi:hypothetical protein